VSRLRIFETDPEAKPRKFTSDIVGRFRSGMTDGKRPVSLDEWRVTTGDPDVAAKIAEMFGGEPEEWDTESEEYLQVLTDHSEISIIIDGPSAIESDLKLWGMGGKIVHHCDGVEFLDDDRRGKPCGCPELLRERKEAAKAGHGPKPDTRIKFRLFDAPELGQFEFRSGSWDLVRVLHEIENALEDVDEPARCTLALVDVEFDIKRGPRRGTHVSYKKPVVTVHGPAAE